MRQYDAIHTAQPNAAKPSLTEKVVKLLKLARLKQPVFLLVDTSLVVIALFLSFLIRFGLHMPAVYMGMLFSIIPIAALTKIPVFYLFGFYHQLWEYAGLREGLRLIWGITVASFLFLGVLWLTRELQIPRGVFVVDWMLTLALVGGSYFVIPAKKDLFPTFNFMITEEQKRAIIVGAGDVGSSLVRQMQRNPQCGYKPIAILDDDPSKTGLMVHGVEVVGTSRTIPLAITKYPADEIILAIPSAAARERHRIALECKAVGMHCKTVPDLSELVGGTINLSAIRDIEPKELLGREEVATDLSDTIGCYRGRVVLVTGAAGSIGSEICRQVVNLEPKLVIATDISENGLYHLEEEMAGRLSGQKGLFEVHIMDVRDAKAVERVFAMFKPQIVFHAAAYKHVPMMEKHMQEAMENNFLGTRTVIDAAKRHLCERFTFISTDKAVNPTSTMGLSKQLGERSVKVAASEESKTKFMAVRFGNVLGSNGSVIPKFKRQISNGEPITVTHQSITRFFMTIQEAVYLVTQATAIGQGGEVFVLDMGEPVRIYELAQNIIRLSGLEPNKDIPIFITGLRPGEKLYEELFADGETKSKTVHPKVNQAFSTQDVNADLQFLSKLERILRAGNKDAFSKLLSIETLEAREKA